MQVALVHLAFIGQWTSLGVGESCFYVSPPLGVALWVASCIHRACIINTLALFC